MIAARLKVGPGGLPSVIVITEPVVTFVNGVEETVLPAFGFNVTLPVKAPAIVKGNELPPAPIAVLLTLRVALLLVLVNVHVMVCACPLALAPVSDCGIVMDGATAVPPTVTAVPAALIQDEVVA